MDETFLRDLFQSLPDIAIRRMFGGQGIYSDGRIVAVVLRGTLYLKGDAAGEAAYEAAAMERWTYQRPGKAAVKMPYWRFPDDGYDDPDVAAAFIRVADAAARRAALSEKPKPTRTGRTRKRMTTKSTAAKSPRPSSAG
ncbi:TfoX/Sxy family protein [Jiella sp. MQZ9-1]|uniref:TfoX/Sxy family protein n=1 Tax=Jiella flava TaxID=2816857 RepID=A0A939FXR9_9HYPH|nr:TfoX/Sxy family protein [Jiella flava]MBO0662829.1 TfoX/Sxy family protein [Jiella flava]MCD2471410.1 TfoX/Sxy family protein [Jiella flava]